MAIREVTELGVFRHSGVLGANQPWRPTARSGNAELGTREMAEIVRVEVRAPVTGAGVIEALDAIYLILDDTPMPQYIYLSGRDDSLMTPPAQHVQGGLVVNFGDLGAGPEDKALGILDALALQAETEVSGLSPRNVALRTVLPRYRQSVRPVAVAGETDVTEDFEIVILGRRYSEKQLLASRRAATLSGAFEIVDRARDKRLAFDKGPLPVDWDHWHELPGGPSQSNPIVMPFWRWARNAQAAAAYQEYQFRFETGGAAEREQDLYFPFDQKDMAILLTHLGFRGPLAAAYHAWVQVSGDTVHQEHPWNRYRVPNGGNNRAHFGAAQPLYPDGLPLYFGLPTFADDKLLLYDELSWVAVEAQGADIAANGLTVAAAGIVFENLGRS